MSLVPAQVEFGRAQHHKAYTSIVGSNPGAHGDLLGRARTIAPLRLGSV